MVINESITETEYRTMVNYYLLQIYFVSECEWNYLVYEAYSCEVNLLLIKNDLSTFTVSDPKLVLEKYEIHKYKHKYGNKYDLDENEIARMIEKLISIPRNDLVSNGKKNRQFFLEKRKDSRKKFEGYFSKMIELCDDYSKFTIPDRIDTDELPLHKLPNITIITLYSHPSILVDTLIKHNINHTTYPKDKIQWIVGANNELDINDLDCSLKYKFVELDETMKLGERYNKCIKNAKTDYIIIMHDDCIYYPNSIFNRIYSLLQEDINCVYCSNKAYYDVIERSYYYTTTSLYNDIYQRCHPFSFGFSKKFWQEHPFKDEWNNYSDVEFIKDRYSQCKEISWVNMGISILHSKNNYTKNLKIVKKEIKNIDIKGLEYLNIIQNKKARDSMSLNSDQYSENMKNPEDIGKKYQENAIIKNKLDEEEESNTIIKNKLDEEEESNTIIENKLDEEEESNTIIKNKLDDIGSLYMALKDNKLLKNDLIDNTVIDNRDIYEKSFASNTHDDIGQYYLSKNSGGKM